MGSNNFLPNSTIQATYYVPSSVDFGEVFATEALAQADALNRLATAMGPLVSATSITTDASSIQSVPSLWGPLVVEVRVWH